ncbi:hypothetical protein DL95DRAFT_417224 [Leptodontidium sp. 2 PMI_412]|nr:hypothetical protein DL95DRAFT_417224 [Leptodontidium sp. 2 PMI_412]
MAMKPVGNQSCKALDKAADIDNRRRQGGALTPTQAPKTAYTPRLNNTQAAYVARGVQVKSMMEFSVRGGVSKITDTEHQDNQDALGSPVGEKSSSGDKAEGNDQSSSGKENRRSVAVPFNEEAVVVVGNPSHDDSSSGDSDDEFNEGLDSGSEED